MLITLSRLIKKKYLVFMAIVLAVFLLFGEMYHFFILSNVKSMKLTLNYSGAEQGLNPDGSRFNISEMATDDIINEAKAGLKMEKESATAIKKRLFITTKFSQNAMDEVVSDIRSGMEGTYVPTTFYVYYSQANKLRKNETCEFLNSLAETYRKNFYAKHAENNSALEYKPEEIDFSDYDYSEIYTVLSDKSEQMLSLVSQHLEENRGFRSKDNLNFGTLREELSNFKNVKLEKFNAYVVQNDISKDRPANASKLNYLISKNVLEHDKLSQASDIAKDVLADYDAQIAAIAFVPSVDSSNSYYMSRTKTGIDDLAKRSYSDGMEAAAVSKKIDKYSNIYEKLRGAADSSAEQLSAADGYLADIITNMQEISDRIVALDNEYLDYKTESYISYTVQEKSPVFSLSVLFKFLILGFLLALMFIVYLEFWHDSVHSRTRYVTKAISVMTKSDGEE